MNYVYSEDGICTLTHAAQTRVLETGFTETREIKVTTDLHGLTIEIEGCEQSVIIDIFSQPRCFIMDENGEAIDDGIELK